MEDGVRHLMLARSLRFPPLHSLSSGSLTTTTTTTTTQRSAQQRPRKRTPSSLRAPPSSHASQQQLVPEEMICTAAHKPHLSLSLFPASSPWPRRSRRSCFSGPICGAEVHCNVPFVPWYLTLLDAKIMSGSGRTTNYRCKDYKATTRVVPFVRTTRAVYG
ncbi:hypothetical protein BJ546DRAFT_157967 [Cryomyces antarcticus]